MVTEISSLKIGRPAQRAMTEKGITTLSQLCDYTEKELLAFHGVGPKAISILKELMTKEGLSFKG